MNSLSKFIASLAALIASVALLWLSIHITARPGIFLSVRGNVGHFDSNVIDVP
jgi:hypothetical protein